MPDALVPVRLEAIAEHLYGHAVEEYGLAPWAELSTDERRQVIKEAREANELLPLARSRQ